MTPQAKSSNGPWESAHPLGWQGSGPDYEVSQEDGRYVWEAYDEDVLIGKGAAQTRLGLALALWRHKRKWVA